MAGFSSFPTPRERLELLLKDSKHCFEKLHNDKVPELIAEELNCPGILVHSLFFAIQNEVEISGDPTTGTLFPKAPREGRIKDEKSEKSEDLLRRHIRAANHKQDQNSIDRVVSNSGMPPNITERIRFIIVQFLLNVLDGCNEELGRGLITQPIQRKSSDYLSDSFATGVEFLLHALAILNRADDVNHDFTALWLKRLGEAIASGDMGNTPDVWLAKWRSDGKTLLQDEYALARRRRANNQPPPLQSIPVPEERELCSNVEPPADAMSMYCVNEDYHHWQYGDNPHFTRSNALYEYEQDIWKIMDDKARKPFERLRDEDFARYLYQKYIVAQDYLFDDDASRDWRDVIKGKATKIDRPQASRDVGLSDRYRTFLTQEMEEKQREKEKKEAQEKEEMKVAQYSDLQ